MQDQAEDESSHSSPSPATPSRAKKYLRPDPASQIARCDSRIEELEHRIAELAKLEQEKEKEKLATSHQSEAVTSSPARRGRGSKSAADLTVDLTNKSLPQEDIDRLVDRLVRPVRSEVPAEVNASKRILTADDVGELVGRLAVNDLETRKAKFEVLAQAAEDELPLKKIAAAKGENALLKLDMETQQSLGERLCTQAIEAHKQKILKERQEYLQKNMHSGSKLSKGAMKESAGRLYDGAAAKHESEMAKLSTLYLAPLGPQKKLSAEEQKASAERLGKK